MPDKKVLIIKTGSTLPSLKKRFGDFEDWIISGLGLPSRQTLVRNVEKGEILPITSSICGAVITGSHAMVSERLPWSEVTAGWLRTAFKDGLPLLGICYGHQLLAHAFGGEVNTNPRGPEYGTVDIHLKPEATEDPLFKNVPSQIKAQVSHSQSVLKLPGNSILLAGSDGEPHHAFRIGSSCWGIQFHPEFNTEITKTYINEHKQELAGHGLNAEEIIANAADTPKAAAILKGFASLIRN